MASPAKYQNRKAHTPPHPRPASTAAVTSESAAATVWCVGACCILVGALQLRATATALGLALCSCDLQAFESHPIDWAHAHTHAHAYNTTQHSCPVTWLLSME